MHGTITNMSYSVCKLSVWNLGQVTTRQYIRPNTIQYNSQFVYDSYCPLIFASFFSRAHFLPPISSSSCSSLSFIPRSCPLFTFPFYLIFFLGKVGLVWHVADFATADRWLGVLIYSFKIQVFFTTVGHCAAVSELREIVRRMPITHFKEWRSVLC